MLPDGAHFITLDSAARAFIWNLSTPTVTAEPWLKQVSCRKVYSGGRGEDGVVAAWCGDGTVHLFGPAGTETAVMLRRRAS